MNKRNRKMVQRVAVILLIIFALGCNTSSNSLESPGSGSKKNKSADILTDSESIQKGSGLFNKNCKFCHNTNDTATLVGPGLKGILKKTRLPFSKKPATPENIRMQIRKPFKSMPSFSDLTDEEVLYIISFLNTL